MSGLFGVIPSSKSRWSSDHLLKSAFTSLKEAESLGGHAMGPSMYNPD